MAHAGGRFHVAVCGGSGVGGDSCECTRCRATTLGGWPLSLERSSNASVLPFPGRRRAAPEIAEWEAPSSSAKTSTKLRQTIRTSTFLSKAQATELENWQRTYLRDGAELFRRRAEQKRVRDGHGDLRLEHVYVQGSEITVLDCIEFNDRFRYADVCSDIAFLSMDLEALGRVDLAELLLARYARHANDFDLYGLVDSTRVTSLRRAKVTLSRYRRRCRHTARRLLGSSAALRAARVRRSEAGRPAGVVAVGHDRLGQKHVGERLGSSYQARGGHVPLRNTAGAAARNPSTRDLSRALFSSPTSSVRLASRRASSCSVTADP